MHATGHKAGYDGIVTELKKITRALQKEIFLIGDLWYNILILIFSF